MCPVARLTRSVNEEKICVFGVAPRPWDEGPLLAHAARSAPTPASTCSPPVPGCSGRTAKGRTRLFRAAFIRALPRALTATWSQPIFPPRAADRVAPRPGLCSQGSRSGRRRSFDHLHFDAIEFDDGLLKVHVVSNSGSDRVLAVLGGRTIVGELSMLEGAPRSASVSALRPSKLSFVTRAAFNATLDGHPEIYRELALVLTGRLRDINDAMAATSFLSLRGRAARVLLALADAFGQDVGNGRIVIRQKVSQSDIAAMAGIVRESFSRVLHDWLGRSLVSRLAGYYCLENKSALEHECDF